ARNGVPRRATAVTSEAHQAAEYTDGEGGEALSTNAEPQRRPGAPSDLRSADTQNTQGGPPSTSSGTGSPCPTPSLHRPGHSRTLVVPHRSAPPPRVIPL